MVNYEVTVHNSERFKAYTREYIYITLVGEKGQSKTTWLSGAKSFLGMELKCTITTEKALGKLQQVVVQKKPLLFLNDHWFPTKIEVKTDTNETYIFPLYTWITDSEKHYFREGQAFIPSKDPFDSSSRQEELDNRQEAYRWKTSGEGLPDHIKAKEPTDLHLDAQFILLKEIWLNTQGFIA
ncbi:polyunsaturated fatty acid 5-lipoxygenase-like [Cyprinodon tularosa]|uniref:polyunsaturated fatty acid 5-lipoxygenase-like n=1 Tax=Cyprinodon tularosa TaxID=77115 RepID=UPI0018E287A3|nr:polyunsaturated fatty acid 5-lipoxygenase-like [Cyprinodon tularosa]